MSDASAGLKSRRSTHRVARVLPWVVGLGFFACGSVAAALAAPAAKPTVSAAFQITKLADAPKGSGNCDDLAFLDGNLYMGCQNKTLSIGGGGNSTLLEYTAAGALVKTWSVKDKIDGLNADPLHHRLIVTENEDANSHLFTLAPAAPAAQQIVNYTYSPDPRGASTPVALRTGGGTDQVSVDSTGHILITGSHAGTKTGTAVFKVVLTAPSTPTGMGTATLSPTWLDNATAANGNTSTGTTKLSLGDVDSGAIVPQSSPRFGGSYVIDDQTALELVFSSNIFAGTGLTALKTPFGLDDILWTSSAAGTLYVVDKGATANLPKVSASALYKVTGPFVKDTVLASNDGASDQVVKVNLTSGALTPFVRHLQTSKGLVYVDASGTQTQLPLSGTPVAATTTAAAPATKTTAAAPASTTTTKKSTGSSSTAVIVVIIIVVLLALGGGYAFSRRRRGAR